jgi:hypothetical protein
LLEMMCSSSLSSVGVSVMMVFHSAAALYSEPVINISIVNGNDRVN